jgi:5,10-methylenetetrahydromethanopterin reductase
LIARLNACIAADGRVARDLLRPGVARLLGRGTLKLATAETQGLTLPADAVAKIADARYAAGVTPYLPLVPMVSDRHVNAFALGGSVDEIVAHVVALRRAGISSIIIRPLASQGCSVEGIIETFGKEIWPAVQEAMVP